MSETINPLFSKRLHWGDRSADEPSVAEKSIIDAHLSRKKPEVGQKRPFFVDEWPGSGHHVPSNLNGCIVEITNIDADGNVTCKFDLNDSAVKEVHGRLGMETYTSNIRYLFNVTK